MITVGIDLAAEPKNTAGAAVDWRGHPRVTRLETGMSDDALTALGTGAAKIGIDCPLGWPEAFVDFVVAHRAGVVDEPADTIAARRPLAYRITDLRCMRDGLRPLSVSADRIGYAAMRCAGLLAALRETDRSGLGRVVEVYPAASLRQWRLPFRRYKALAGREQRDVIVGALEQVVDLGDARQLCIDSDHALDAVIAALSARAAALGAATLPAEQHLAAARVEGWIAVPTCALAELG